jgi:hypothetical protein
MPYRHEALFFASQEALLERLDRHVELNERGSAGLHADCRSTIQGPDLCL